MRPGYQEQILYILNKHHSIVTVELGDAVTDDILQLIDSAKREAELEWQIDQTTELARQNFMYRCLYGEAPLEYKGVNTLIAYQTYREGDDFRKNFARYVEQLAAQLEQSEESE